MAEVQALAAEIADFLAKMEVDGEPDDDAPRAERVAGRIVDACTPEPWDDALWNTTLDRFADAVAARLPTDPRRWASHLRLLDIYFSSAWLVRDHPGWDNNHTRGGRGQAVRRRVPLELAARVARSSLPHWSAEARIELWRILDDWDVWRAAITVVPDLDLQVTEAAAMLSAVEAFAAGDLAAADLLRHTEDWMRRHPGTARELGDQWRERREPRLDLPLVAVARLIDVTVRAAWDPRWRKEMLDALAHARHGSEGIELATLLVYRTWPDGTPPSKRAEALVEWTAARPRELRHAALWSLRTLAPEAPVETLQIAARLLKLPPATTDPTTARREARAASATLAQVGRGLEGRQDIDPAQIAALVRPIVRILDPSVSREGWDSFLARLTGMDIGQVERLVTDWIADRAEGAQMPTRDLRELLPLTVGALDKRAPTALGQWMARWIAGPAPMWKIGVRFAAGTFRAGLPTTILAALSDTQLVAVAYRLLGTPYMRADTVGAVVSWARQRPSAAPELLHAILAVGVPTFPGGVRAALRDWRAELGDGESPDVLTRLEAALTAQDEAYRARRAIPRSLLVAPIRDAWDMHEARRLRGAMEEERHSGRSAVASLFLRVPVARGGGTYIERGDGKTKAFQPFTELRHETELPARDTYDPVGARLARAELLTLANRGPAEEAP